MEPKIDDSGFGWITLGGKRHEHDLLIGLDGEAKKRKKKLSKKVYGTSHTISLDEARFVYEKGAEKILIGAGQSGMVELSREARDYFEKKKCAVQILPTPEAVDVWNGLTGRVIGLFHVTC